MVITGAKRLKLWGQAAISNFIKTTITKLYTAVSPTFRARFPGLLATAIAYATGFCTANAFCAFNMIAAFAGFRLAGTPGF